MELFDLYDQNRQPLNQTMVRGTKQPTGTFRPAVHVCIFSPEGKMLCQRRQPSREDWSGMWDVSAAGSVISGETSADGARREAFEELGLQLPESIVPAFTVYGSRVFDDWYCLNVDVDQSALCLQQEEVAEAAWFSQDEILQKIVEGSFIPYEDSLLVLAFALRNHRGVYKGKDKAKEKRLKKKSEPVIYTSRLRLAKMKVSDAPQAFKWCSDPEVTHFLRYSTYTEIEQLEQWIQQPSDDCLFGVFLNDGTEEGTLIGSISCPLRSRGTSRELGYSFNKDYWGHGYATEACKALVAYCAEHFETKDFWASHAVENTRSQRVIEKCGFAHVIDSAYTTNDGITFDSHDCAMRISLHRMDLSVEPFEKMIAGNKTVELRLNDEKRRNFDVGDYLVFECDDEKIVAKIKEIRRYDSFEALYEAEDLTKCGYTSDEVACGTARPEDMLQYYSAEKQSQYGVLAIEIELLANY